MTSSRVDVPEIATEPPGWVAAIVFNVTTGLLAKAAVGTSDKQSAKINNKLNLRNFTFTFLAFNFYLFK